MKKVCKTCGMEFEGKDGRSVYCSDACRHDGIRKSVRMSKRRIRARAQGLDHVVELRLRESAMRVADGSPRRDRAAVVYVVETSHDGTCVVEWRGTVPAHLRFVHGQGGM